MDEVTADTHCPDHWYEMVWNWNSLGSLLLRFLFVPQLTPRKLDTTTETHVFQSFIPSFKKYLLCDHNSSTSYLVIKLDIYFHCCNYTSCPS